MGGGITYEQDGSVHEIRTQKDLERYHRYIIEQRVKREAEETEKLTKPQSKLNLLKAGIQTFIEQFEVFPGGGYSVREKRFNEFKEFLKKNYKIEF